MPYVIQLEPDIAAKAAIQSAWCRVCDLVMAPDARRSIQPHISLTACSWLDVGSASLEMRRSLRAVSVVPVEFVSVGSFLSSEGAVFLAPVPTTQLLELQAQVTGILKASKGEPKGYYAGNKWMPHCTLATGLDESETAIVLGLCLQALQPLQPIEAVFDIVSLVEYGSGPAVWHERVRLAD